MPKYIIREANESDLSGIAHLRQNIDEFMPISIENYINLWKFIVMENPCSIQKSMVAINDKEEIVAHYAMLPFKFLKSGILLTGGFVCQLMVNTKYRQEMLFPKMEIKMLKEYNMLGIDFAYSVSNRPEVVKAHLAFGFKKIGMFHVLARPYNLHTIVKHNVSNNLFNTIISPLLHVAEKVLSINKSHAKGNLHITETNKFDLEIDLFIEEAQRRFANIALRNSEILNWRILESPGKKYRILIARDKGTICGYVILRKMTMKQFNVLAIVDILFLPEKFYIGKIMLSCVHNIAIRENVDMSVCFMSASDLLYPVFRKYGYFKTPESFTLFVHEPKDSNTGLSSDSLDKWHLTWFDNDSV